MSPRRIFPQLDFRAALPFVRLLLCAAWLLPVAQLGAELHAISHLGVARSSQPADAQTAHGSSCETCLGFSALGSGVTAVSAPHLIWPPTAISMAAAPLPPLSSAFRPAYSSRAPPVFLV